MEERRVGGDRREDVSLREHMDQRFTDLERRIDITPRSLESRLEGMNELRSQITSERGTYMTRTEFESKHVDLERRMNSAERQIAKATGIAAAVGLAAGFLSHVIKWP